MQWRKHVRIKYGGRVGVGQGQREREQVQLQVRVVQLQREGGARLSYVCHQPQLSSTARRSCSAAAMLCCGRRKRTSEMRQRLFGTTVLCEFRTNAKGACTTVGNKRNKPFPNAHMRWEEFRKKEGRFRMNSTKPTRINEWQ
ncbi:uncharacterized protein LOC112589500, partial [Harpegnathos saltator]|uniref:uncharacterized protein LOC112589500 n=1 Tax=Harpegnathos saltator TaxID=610380 RepID=UPI000DBEF0EE